MISRVRTGVFAALLAVLAVPCVSATARAEQQDTFRVAQAGGISEKEAFEAAKELGTIEAWEAFLENFPEGFRADLARAYVRRLAGQPAPAPAPGPAPAEAQPAPAATPPALDTVDLGPGNVPWSRGSHDMDEGNSKAPAAIVQGKGVRLTAYCTSQRLVPVMVSGEPRGVYPDFDERVRQGLSAAGGGPDGHNEATVAMRFVGGQEYNVRAQLHGLTGDVMLGESADGFAAYSHMLETLMAGKTVTVSAPPFSATFQLTGSRDAICGMLKQCGLAASQPGCS